MRSRERRETGQTDLFRSRLDQIINLEHALVKLARAIDWGFLAGTFGAVYEDGPGHAKQFNRANRALRKRRTILGRVIRDIGRKTRDDEALRDIFAMPLYRSRMVLAQKRGQRGAKIYSLHAPEVECIGKSLSPT